MPDRKHQTHLIRVALLLYKTLNVSRKPLPLVLPETKWLDCQRLVRLLKKAIHKGWFAAAKRIHLRLDQALREFHAFLDQTLTDLKQHLPVPRSLRNLHRELVGLYDEFPNAECNLRRKTISVTTDSVTLEEVDLGSFRIELPVGIDGSGAEYSVIATDPNPAGNDEDVTHPHVRDNCLCEGEGTIPIRRALDEGRLVDFFQIVEQILHTYNSASAYVSLDEWNGISCCACGEFVNEDERTSCSRTSDSLCYECTVTCPNCHQDFAPDLVECCQKCDENYCDRCIEKGICHACQEEICEAEVLVDQQVQT